MRKLYVAALLVGIGLSTALFFNNCGRALPDGLNTAVSSSTTGGFGVSISANSITNDQTALLSITGGSAPYQITVAQGTASVDPQGRITGPYSLGSIVFLVRDASGLSSQIGLFVSAKTTTGTVSPSPTPTPGPTPTPTPTPVLASCVTPFGTTIAHGASVTTFAEAQAVCPTSMACQAQTRTCNNGVLSGTFAATSCALLSCVYRELKYTNDFYSGQTLCPQQYVNDNTGYRDVIPRVPSAPETCSYGASQPLCVVNSFSNQDTSTYSYKYFECKGRNELINSQYFQVSPPFDGGGAGR